MVTVFFPRHIHPRLLVDAIALQGTAGSAGGAAAGDAAVGGGEGCKQEGC